MTELRTILRMGALILVACCQGEDWQDLATFDSPSTMYTITLQRSDPSGALSEWHYRLALRHRDSRTAELAVLWEADRCKPHSVSWESDSSIRVLVAPRDASCGNARVQSWKEVSINVVRDEGREEVGHGSAGRRPEA
jgi:hypothetical protein